MRCANSWMNGRNSELSERVYALTLRRMGHIGLMGQMGPIH